jgi:hypothetical protein
MSGYHLAQVNIALPLEPLDSARLRDFVAQLASVNAVADSTPGFVWRLQTEDGDATGIRGFGDDALIVNLSVWASLEALRGFVFESRAHVDVLRRRREWFERMAEAFTALWWVPQGHLPSVAEAEERLALLRSLGPSDLAFTFKRHFPPPTEAPLPVDDERSLCPAG